MARITLEIPDAVVRRLRVPRAQASRILMEELVLRLYQQGIITSGQGASLLSLDRLRFESFLAEHEVSIHAEADTLSHDIDALR